MAILKGIEVNVVPTNSRGDIVKSPPLEELSISPQQKGRKILSKDQEKQTVCFLRAKEETYVAICIKADSPAEWLKKSKKSEFISVDVSVDGGSLTQTKVFSKSDLNSKCKIYISKFVYEESCTNQRYCSGARFEKRNDSKLLNLLGESYTHEIRS